MRYSFAMAAARAGKPFFCEERIAVSADEVKRMWRAAEGAGVVRYFNHSYRRYPSVCWDPGSAICC
jgi:predicted dehydrogenase